jgi:hypothetical protein
MIRDSRATALLVFKLVLVLIVAVSMWILRDSPLWAHALWAGMVVVIAADAVRTFRTANRSEDPPDQQ